MSSNYYDDPGAGKLIKRPNGNGGRRGKQKIGGKYVRQEERGGKESIERDDAAS